MINNISSSGIQSVAFKNATTTPIANKVLEAEKKSDSSSSISFSPSAKLHINISNLEKQLDKIFGVPKELSKTELKQEEKLHNEIDKILNAAGGIQLSKADQITANKIDKQIEKIFKDDKVTPEEEKQLNSLDQRMEKLYENYEGPELNASQEKKLDNLFQQLDTLQGLKTPNKEGLLQAEKLYSALDKASAQLEKLTVNSELSFSNDAKLILKISNFEKQLDKLFGTPKELSKVELKQEERLNNEIDKILNSEGSIQLSKADQVTSNKIDKQIENIFKDDIVTPEEEKQLNSLDKRMEKLYEKYEGPELSASQEKQLDNLFKQLDTLYGLKTPNKEGLLQAEKLYAALDKTVDELQKNNPHYQS